MNMVYNNVSYIIYVNFLFLIYDLDNATYNYETTAYNNIPRAYMYKLWTHNI